MPENIADIVLKIILAIRAASTRVRLNTPVLICFREIRLLGSPSIGMDFVPRLL